jgi:hypothetical protein
MVASVVSALPPGPAGSEVPSRLDRSPLPSQSTRSDPSLLSEHSSLPDRAILPGQSAIRDADDLSIGFLLGLLVGEGHFGGDGRQPQVTLRMHVRHEQTFEWLHRTYPGSALYGPYHHGGRSYYQWSARGKYLREYIVPLVERHRALLDTYTAARFDTMCERYSIAREGFAGSADA